MTHGVHPSFSCICACCDWGNIALVPSILCAEPVAGTWHICVLSVLELCSCCTLVSYVILNEVIAIKPMSSLISSGGKHMFRRPSLVWVQL